MAALEANEISYDLWDIGWDNDVRGSPSRELLQAYPFVIWYTGYDWFRPVDNAELQTLSQYLAQGGRLFLNSQDFLYYHHAKPFTQNYLGILDYQESVTPTQIFAGRASPGWLQQPGPYTLDYGPYRNFSDGLVPRPSAAVMVWHDGGMPAGLGWSGPDWRTTFWAFPLETLPLTAQAAALQDALSWLSDLGASSFVVSQPDGDWAIGSQHRYTLTIHNNAHVSNLVTVTNPLPAAFTLLTTTLSDGASYAAATHTVSWQGSLAAGDQTELSYKIIVNAPIPTDVPLRNIADLGCSRHALPVRRVAISWPGAMDLAGSQFWLTPVSLQPPGGRYSATLRLVLPEPAGHLSGTLLVPDGALSPQHNPAGQPWRHPMARAAAALARTGPTGRASHPHPGLHQQDRCDRGLVTVWLAGRARQQLSLQLGNVAQPATVAALAANHCAPLNRWVKFGEGKVYETSSPGSLC